MVVVQSLSHSEEAVIRDTSELVCHIHIVISYTNPFGIQLACAAYYATQFDVRAFGVVTIQVF